MTRSRITQSCGSSGMRAASPTKRWARSESCACSNRLRARGGRKPRFALGQSRYDRPMLSLLYLVVRALVRLLISAGQPGRADGSKDLEILVLSMAAATHHIAANGCGP